jgi:hypothetical protein
MNDERAALLGAMYQQPVAAKRNGKTAAAIGGKSRRIRVGIIEYEVPTVEAVAHLEQIVAQQANEIAQQKRLLARLLSSLNLTQGFIRRQANRVPEQRQHYTREAL